MTLLLRASEVSATKSPIEFAGAKIRIPDRMVEISKIKIQIFFKIFVVIITVPIMVFETFQNIPSAAKILTISLQIA